eukprot:TRINITY_DN9361_c0_g1_i1.p2 TRINITY_DN9361_c0_g1~~TRINITY_DN9361_c0_g1_i1.p2  ORF type:complete len:305 (+),score=90.13 TRINITY_DN9361_c0_g1_i1:57-971(+)
MGSNKQWSFNKYVEVGAIGALRGLIGLPLEHPFDCVKTFLQAYPHLKSPSNAARHIYQTKGLVGFYSGAIPNGLRLSIKQGYRWPLMLSLPPFFNRMVSKEIQSGIPFSIERSLTGLTIASIESFIICPLERLKVHLMTGKEIDKHGLRTFIEKHSNTVSTERNQLITTPLRKELFRGLKAVYVRGIVSWVSFLVADQKTKSWAREWTGSKQLSLLTLMICSVFVGGINTFTNMPFDVVKTTLQKRDLSGKEMNGIISTMRVLVKQNGSRILWIGWQPRMAQYILQSFFTMTLLEKLELKWNSS